MGYTVAAKVNGTLYPASYHVVEIVNILPEIAVAAVSIYADADAFAVGDDPLIRRMPCRVAGEDRTTYFSDETLLQAGHSPNERAQAWLLTQPRNAGAVAD